MLIAHRGKSSSNVCENTISAFLETENNPKYSGYELDIRETKDKKIVVVHDFYFKGMLIRATNYEDLKKYNVPLLEDVLKLNSKKKIVIEIKDYQLDLQNLKTILEKYQHLDIYLMSFYNNVIKNYLSISHTCKCGILNYIFNKEYSYNEYDFVCLLNAVITDNIITYFTKRKIEIFSYGIIGNYFETVNGIYYIIDNNQE